MSREAAISTARAIAHDLAADRLRPADARLYSQHSRLRHGQPGLPTWHKDEATRHLNDVVQLLHAGLLLREEQASEWRNCVRRAAELLEWLSHPALELEAVPLRLLSAAAYGLAGLPARADALLRETGATDESRILREYLRGNFPAAVAQVRRYWERRLAEPTKESNGERPALSQWVVDETIRSIGVVCASLRWADEDRAEIAIDKLDAVAMLLTIERDPYSWLLARLTCEAARETLGHAWRRTLAPLAEGMSSVGVEAIDRYARLAFQLRRAIAWPSQEDGVRRLLSPGSFALCTPTGSGKTSVAEVAILQAILNGSFEENSATLCLYLVPSRALAAEVEGKLNRVLRRLTERRIVVTGLYGGTDWGPTDAWLTADEPTVLICTYEKAEALIRFVGPLFLSRLGLVVFDEAHTVQFDQNFSTLRESENRTLRLEALGMRIRQLVAGSSCRLIALSAVAAGLETALNQWVGGDPTDQPVLIRYRSTRQVIGRLHCDTNGRFEIHYDIADDHSLAFSQAPESTPYVPSPLPSCPPGPSSWTGVEKPLRPALLWAALHLGAADDNGIHHGVLISVMQKIGGYARDFLELLENSWVGHTLPSVLRQSLDAGDQQLWDYTVAVCKDYFGVQSYEYRLLMRGIVVHHSSMPKLLTRLLIEVVQAGIANVVLATSTLSEGVNIPVETILVPSLLRGPTPIRASEFRNLAGRAGRPGVATEGRTLVLMRPPTRRPDTSFSRYRFLVRELLSTSPAAEPQSPIAAVINDIWVEWQRLTRSADQGMFLNWLESVSGPPALQVAEEIGSLDTLDGVLLAGLVEHEELRGLAEWESALQDLWNRAFSAYRSSELQRLAFVRRGSAIPALYPDRSLRKRLYRTGLSPATAREVLALADELRAVLAAGHAYATWTPEERISFIVEAVNSIGRIRRFRCPANASEWEAVLRWWLRVPGAIAPRIDKIAEWHKNVSQWFIYKFSWGLGSIIGVSFDAIHGNELRATTLAEWEQTGLPWAVFWLKDLISWGTLDPAAALLLAHGLAQTRTEAESIAGAYYASSFALAVGDPIDPRAIRDWTNASFGAMRVSGENATIRMVAVDTIDEGVAKREGSLGVYPIEVPGGIGWIDSAGYLIAESRGIESEWTADDGELIDFHLVPQDRIVKSRPYV